MYVCMYVVYGWMGGWMYAMYVMYVMYVMYAMYVVNVLHVMYGMYGMYGMHGYGLVCIGMQWYVMECNGM